jgi:hypothetical protein
MSEPPNPELRDWLLSAAAEIAEEQHQPVQKSDDDFMQQKISWDLFEQLFRSPLAAYINQAVIPWSPRPRIPFVPGETVQEALKRFLDAKRAAPHAEESPAG